MNLNEMSIRKLHHIFSGTDPRIKTVALMSGEKGVFPPSDDNVSEFGLEALKSDLSKLGINYRPIYGNYGGVDEKSLAIYNPSIETIKNLAHKYGQEAIIYGTKQHKDGKPSIKWEWYQKYDESGDYQKNKSLTTNKYKIADQDVDFFSSQKKGKKHHNINIDFNFNESVQISESIESSINRFMKSLFDIMTPENMFGNYIKTVSNPKGTLNKLKSFIKKDAQRYFQENSNAKMSSRVKIYDFTQQLLNKLTVDNAFGFFADKMSFDSETILSYVRERISNFSDGFVRQLNEGYMNNDTVMPKADLMDKLVQILQAEGASAIKNNTPESVIKHDVIAWVIKIIQSLKQEG